ncbi:MAG: hypothetical protein IPP13_22220 [Kouleothrix sp.]|nr:hypothetical protein [Kouleothrix sp.]
MPVYHQMGHQSDNLLLDPELQGYAGAILSPVNYDLNTLVKTVSRYRATGNYEAIFDWMRHTAATRFDSRGVGASEACKAALLGHGPRSVTGGYIHVSIEEKRAAIMQAENEMLKRAA